MTFTFPKLSALLLVTLASQCMETRTYPADGGVCGVVCPGARPHCDDTTMTCVACLENAHCGSSKPTCDTSTHTCIACTTNAQCAASGAGSICDIGTGACRACANDGECAGNAGATVCRESTGQCVACTADTEAMKCGLNSCSRTTFTCTGTARGSVGTCRHCQGDSECVSGDHCVPMASGSTALGSYCMHDQVSGACGNTGANSALLPFSFAAVTTSVDGAAVTACFPRQGISCEAINVLGNACVLSSGASAPDDNCGNAAIHDGLCVDPAGSAPPQCAYACGTNQDCRAVLSCNSAAPAFCE